MKNNKFELPGVVKPIVDELDDNPPQEDSTTEDVIEFTDGDGNAHTLTFDGNGGVKETHSTAPHWPSRPPPFEDWPWPPAPPLTEGNTKINSKEYYHSSAGHTTPNRRPPPPMPPVKPPRTETGATQAAEQATQVAELYDNLYREAEERAMESAQKTYDNAIKLELNNISGFKVDLIAHDFAIDHESYYSEVLRLKFKLNDEICFAKFSKDDLWRFKKPDEITLEEVIDGIVREVSQALAVNLTQQLLEQAQQDEYRFSGLAPIMFMKRYTSGTGPR